MNEEIKCAKCESDYEENYYKHNNNIFCFDCLIQELENTKGLNVVTTTHYYNDDWGELGTDDDIAEVIQNICEDCDVEEIKS
ncbi:MAG TPA: hypothetical protein DCE23_04105 [Firmicutes bacterium]|nr:hypothetical protein [Bacillota bacterium]